MSCVRLLKAEEAAFEAIDDTAQTTVTAYLSNRAAYALHLPVKGGRRTPNFPAPQRDWPTLVDAPRDEGLSARASYHIPWVPESTSRLIMLHAIKQQLPAPARAQLAQARGFLNRYWYRGDTHYCPVCECGSRKFLAAGVSPRPNVRCAVCGSLERHRFDWIFLQRNTDLFDGKPKRMLHFAPERAYKRRLQRISNLEYVTVDLCSHADIRMDITALAFADSSFTAIYCSHVLEHIEDDARALRELYRVLKPGGWAVLQVPITRARTFEDPTVTDRAGRARLFGQEDHVRHCGLDYIERIRAAGFNGSCYYPKDVLGDNVDYFKLGFTDTRVVFYCTKPVY